MGLQEVRTSDFGIPGGVLGPILALPIDAHRLFFDPTQPIALIDPTRGGFVVCLSKPQHGATGRVEKRLSSVAPQLLLSHRVEVWKRAAQIGPAQV